MAKTNSSLEIEMAEFKSELKHISKSQEEFKSDIKEQLSEIKSSNEKQDKKFDAFIEEFRNHAKEEQQLLVREIKAQEDRNDKKYADKKIENWFYACCAIILTSVIIAGLALILK
jgi:RNA polymerase-binding transcription factor DksA